MKTRLSTIHLLALTIFAFVYGVAASVLAQDEAPFVGEWHLTSITDTDSSGRTSEVIDDSQAVFTIHTDGRIEALMDIDGEPNADSGSWDIASYDGTTWSVILTTDESGVQTVAFEMPAPDALTIWVRSGPAQQGLHFYRAGPAGEVGDFWLGSWSMDAERTTTTRAPEALSVTFFDNGSYDASATFGGDEDRNSGDWEVVERDGVCVSLNVDSDSNTERMRLCRRVDGMSLSVNGISIFMARDGAAPVGSGGIGVWGEELVGEWEYNEGATMLRIGQIGRDDLRDDLGGVGFRLEFDEDGTVEVARREAGERRFEEHDGTWRVLRRSESEFTLEMVQEGRENRPEETTVEFVTDNVICVFPDIGEMVLCFDRVE